MKDFSREEATATARRPEITEQHLCGNRNICLATVFSDFQNKYSIYSRWIQLLRNLSPETPKFLLSSSSDIFNFLRTGS